MEKRRCPSLMRVHVLLSFCLLFSAHELHAADDQSVSKEVYDRLQEAQDIVDAKDYQGALQQLKVLYDSDRLTEYEQASVLKYIGFVYYNMEDTAGAIRTYERMLAIPSLEETTVVQTTYTLAQLYTTDGQFEKALTTLDKWFQMEPNPAPEPFILKAQNLHQVSRYSEMIEPIKNAIRVAEVRGAEVKEDWYVLLNFAYFQQKDYAQVRDIQIVLLENWPKERYLKSLVSAYVELGQWEQALHAVDDWMVSGADSGPDLYAMKAGILDALGRNDEMVKPLEQAIAIANERGIEIEDEWRNLLASSQSPGRPEFCREPPRDRPDFAPSQLTYRIEALDHDWARWLMSLDNPSSDLRKEAAEMSVQGVDDKIAQSCTAKALRWHITNLVNRGSGVAQCFLDPAKTGDILALANPLRAQGRHSGGYFVISGCRDGVLDATKCQAITALIDELSLQPSDTCERYFADQVYANFIADLHARDERLAVARAAEQESLDQQRKAQQAKQAADAEADHKRSTYFASTGVTEDRQVIWGSKHGSSTPSDQDPLEAFNMVNSDYLQNLTIPSDHATFMPPEKGEFEKTVDYERRVATLHQEHRKALSRTTANLVDQRSQIFSSAWNLHIGPPALFDLSYDPDVEIFTATVASRSGYRIPISLAVPIAEAQERKTTLSEMRPWVMFEFDGERLAPRSAILQSGNTILEVRMVSSTGVQFAFNESQLASYNEGLEQRRLREEEGKRQAAAEKARRYPYIASVECTVMGNNMPMSACLRTDGQIRVQTTEGTSVHTITSFSTASTHTADLTESFQVGVQVGNGSRVGTLTVSIIERTSYSIVGTQVASGAGDFAVITN